MRRSEVAPYVTPPIDAFGDGGFRIAGARHEGHALIVDGAATPWAITGDPKALAREDFQDFTALAEKPDMVVLGVGERLVHPAPEVLDTATACRTYNLLAGEARRVCAALIAI